MKITDIGKANKIKDNHDHRIESGYQVKPSDPVDTNTAWDCLNNARKRMDSSLKLNMLDKSFQQALDSAEGTELFTVWEKGDTDVWKVILKNQKDNWQQDIKYINALNGVGFEVGNTITWQRLGIRWLITWQDYNINEFFRGEIQKAEHMVRWKNEHGQIQQQWAAVQGPIETRAKYEQTRGNTIVGRQNDTVEIWMGSNSPKDVNDLTRYDKINIKGRCWRIQVIDDISNPNILRFSCVEDFNNPVTDDMVALIPNGKIDFAPNEEEPKENKIRIVAPAKIKEKLVSRVYAINEETSEKVKGIWEISGATFNKVDEYEVDVKGTKIGNIITIMFTDEEGNSNIVTAKTVSMFS